MLAWQPIDTAPKDIPISLWRSAFGFDVGSWNEQKHHKKPMPYWTSSLRDFYGVRWAQENPPTHWAPIPGGPQS